MQAALLMPAEFSLIYLGNIFVTLFLLGLEIYIYVTLFFPSYCVDSCTSMSLFNISRLILMWFHFTIEMPKP